MKLGGEECYEPDELPTALSRDLDCKYKIVFNFYKVYFNIIQKEEDVFSSNTKPAFNGNLWCFVAQKSNTDSRFIFVNFNQTCYH